MKLIHKVGAVRVGLTFAIVENSARTVSSKRTVELHGIDDAGNNVTITLDPHAWSRIRVDLDNWLTGPHEAKGGPVAPEK